MSVTISRVRCRCTHTDKPEKCDVTGGILEVHACGKCYQELLDLKNRLVEDNNRMIAACKEAMEDRQCAHRCDGPHEDCICWYCKIGNAIAAALR